ncbi:hypothetical protein ACGFY7_09720 [Streptomyces prunicolor]|uniref:hypothetical protein n=1 Tax=Streptomyces prunicolor TaxID=67348 RepID=UPI00371E21DB
MFATFATFATLAALATGCTAGADAVSKGTALQAEGPGTSGALGYSDVKVGDIFRMAFPLTRNISKQAVSVTGVKILNVPAGVKILGYSVYSVKDTPGYLLGYYETRHPSAGSVDPGAYPDYAGHPYAIKPKALSDKYAMVRVQVTGKVTGKISGCEADYTQAGHAYRQTLSCRFGLDM